MCCDNWDKFTGQIFETNDLLWTTKGLAFVDSEYTDKTPSRISSMPEDWSFSFDDGGINKRRRDAYGSEFISKTGWLYRNKSYGNSRSNIKILSVCRLNFRAKKKL